jgi:hypothetical protein
MTLNYKFLRITLNVNENESASLETLAGSWNFSRTKSLLKKMPINSVSLFWVAHSDVE